MMPRNCRYCGKEYTENRYGYCSDLCMTLHRAGNIDMAISMKKLLENADHLNKNDKKWIIEIPIHMYNIFFGKHVEMPDFISSLKNASSKSIPAEYRILVAYINASRRKMETFIEIPEIYRAVANRWIYTIIKPFVNVNQGEMPTHFQRYNEEIEKTLKMLEKIFLLPSSTISLMRESRINLNIDAFAKKTLKSARTVVYVLARIANVPISQDEFGTVFMITPVSIRKISREIIDGMNKSGILKMDERFNGIVKNLKNLAIT